MLSRRASTLSFLLVVLLNNYQCSTVTAKKDHNKPHPHRGILKAYNPGPFEDLKLSRQDESKLQQGQPVTKQTMPSEDDPDAGGGVICIQDVHAPKEAVWNQILDLDAYQGKVSKVNKCKNYFVSKNKDGSSTMKTRMVIGVLPGYSYESYYDHTYSPDRDSLTWNLDYDKTSDFDDVSGHWHVEDHPSTPGRSRVFYACDIKMKGSVPKPILSYISKSALKQATGWVKKESEQNPEATVPSQYAGASSKMMSFGKK